MKRNIMKDMAIGVALMTLWGCGSPSSNQPCSRIAALDDAAWNESEWISVVNAPVVTGIVDSNNGRKNERAADGASWFVTTLKNEQKVTDARWMTTGLGVYELYVNGQLIGEEILKPGFTHYAKTKRSFTYDVTNAFNTAAGAENQLAVQVTPGWWADKIITPGGHEGMIGKKVAFRGVLELTFANGSKKLYGSNTSDWKAGIAGPVKHADIFDGEEYDARVAPGFEELQALSTPEKNTEFNGEILPSDGAEIYLRHDLALKPQLVYTWKGVTGESEDAYGKVVITKEYQPGQEITLPAGETLVVDFGQNAAAVPSFVFSAKAGTKLTCLPAEIA